MKEFPDHYAALGIRPTADQEVIAAAYRALVKKYHPDTAQGADATAAERFRSVKAAHDVLGNPERRRDYDAQRAARGLDRHNAAFGSGEAALAAGDGWRPDGAGAQALPGRSGHHSTRPAESVLRADRVHHGDYGQEEGGLFRFAVVTALACVIVAGVLLVLWPSISGSFGGRSGEVEALSPPPQPESQPAPAKPQNVTETAKSDPADGGGALDATIPQGGAEETPPVAEPAPPEPAAQKPQPKVIEEDAASLYALSMREESNGMTTTLADGTLTFNTRKACEDFARQARDRRLDAAVLATGEQPEISWECKGR